MSLVKKKKEEELERSDVSRKALNYEANKIENEVQEILWNLRNQVEKAFDSNKKGHTIGLNGGLSNWALDFSDENTDLIYLLETNPHILDNQGNEMINMEIVFPQTPRVILHFYHQYYTNQCKKFYQKRTVCLFLMASLFANCGVNNVSTLLVNQFCSIISQSRLSEWTSSQYEPSSLMKENCTNTATRSLHEQTRTGGVELNLKEVLGYYVDHYDVENSNNGRKAGENDSEKNWTHLDVWAESYRTLSDARRKGVILFATVLFFIYCYYFPF
eukprot:TRINITY_DN1904_c0_g1_i1.p1 TRINITY_DN1904_c0_g1~~TRINITY_DN1904_c0_g1_i1.p1  ORF type:complete len:273 (-),score=45.14 TRINITY_DN1904_c0_g1_i1:248-1066(-)